MIHYITIGTLLGLSAGLAPGPLLTLVISETLYHDIKAGIRVSLVPLITDLPIVALTVYIVSGLSGFESLLGCISIVGSIVVMIMGVKGMQVKGVALDSGSQKSRSLQKGILVNALNPHPYLFWFSVGALVITRAKEANLIYAVAFVISFYGLLLGSKVVLAMLVGKSKSILKGRMYIFAMRSLGFALCVLAVYLFKDGLYLLGVV